MSWSWHQRTQKLRPFGTSSVGSSEEDSDRRRDSDDNEAVSPSLYSKGPSMSTTCPFLLLLPVLRPAGPALLMSVLWSATLLLTSGDRHSGCFLP